MTAKKPAPRAVREALGLYEAKTQLSSLVDRAAAGEEIIIMKSGQPMARLVPIEERRHARVPGLGRGQWSVSADFDAPLDAATLGDFEGR